VTFWVATGMIAAAFIPALLLPRHRPTEQTPSADQPETVAVG
jgi:hypothetical protein